MSRSSCNFFLLTFVLALRDSAPLAGLVRAASLSSESLSESPRSLSSMIWLFFKLIGFLDMKFVPVLFDRVTATPFTEVVRDFALVEVTVPETRDAGTVLATVVVTFLHSAALSGYLRKYI